MYYSVILSRCYYKKLEKTKKNIENFSDSTKKIDSKKKVQIPYQDFKHQPKPNATNSRQGKSYQHEGAISETQFQDQFQDHIRDISKGFIKSEFQIIIIPLYTSAKETLS